MTWWIWKTTLAISALLYDPVFAKEELGGSTGGTSFTLSNPLAPCGNGSEPGLVCIANAIISGLFDISIPVVAIMILIGGFQIMTAGGNEEKFKTGRKTIMYTVIGFAIILMAKGVVSIVQSLLTP